MAWGLRLRDSAGNVLVDITTRLTRMIGSLQTGTTNGSITDVAGFTGQSVWWALVPTGAVGIKLAPAVTYNASTKTLSWATPSGRPSHTNCVLIYGVY